ncbi:MAG: zinc ribbon domain-containing protein [Blastocatellia bacterium]|nr:zinc ribbon domain-containing protein [Blastocatellia bacterium]
MMNGMQCPRCGTVNYAGVQVCQWCQAPLVGWPPPPFGRPPVVRPEAPSSPRKHPLVLFALALFLPLGVISAGAWKWVGLKGIVIGLGSLGLGMVLSIIALVSINGKPRTYNGSGLAITGMIVNGLLAGLVFFMLPVLGIRELKDAGKLGTTELVWKDVANEDGKYRVKMPVPPVERVEKRPSAIGDLYFFANEVDLKRQGYCGVWYTFYPVVGMKVPVDKLLDGAVEGALKSSGAKLVERKPITLGTFQGAEVTMIPPADKVGEGARSVTRLYWVPPRLYMLMVAGYDNPKGITPTSNIYFQRAQFFDSFTLVDMADLTVTDSPREPLLAESERLATEATGLAQGATSKQDWEAVAEKWKTAIERLPDISPGQPNAGLVKQRREEYEFQFKLAQRQVNAATGAGSGPAYRPFEIPATLSGSFVMFQLTKPNGTTTTQTLQRNDGQFSGLVGGGEGGKRCGLVGFQRQKLVFRQPCSAG